MICPTCDLGIHFTLDGNSDAYPFDDDSKQAEDIGYGSCPECHEIIVVKRKGFYKTADYSSHLIDVVEEQIIYPQPSPRTVDDDETPEPYRTEFAEAAAVLPFSAKASAAISRRILQLVLRNRFKVKPSDLSKEIDEFLGNTKAPTYIAEQIDAVRNVGNFAAHPLKSTETGTIVDVEPGEAEWLLDVLEALFDFAFVQPAKARDATERLNAKLKELGKPPMKTPPASRAG